MTVLPDGSFVVAFVSTTSTIMVVGFTASGQQRFAVSAGSGTGSITLFALDTGGFVVAWSGSGIHSQAFDTAGNRTGAAFLYTTPNSDTGVTQPRGVDVPGPGYMLAWTTQYFIQSPPPEKVQLQRVTDAGAANGSLIDLSAFGGSGLLTGLAALSSGNIAIAYNGTAGSADGISFQIRSPTGNPISGPTDASLSDSAGSVGDLGALTALPGGGFALVGATPYAAGQTQMSEVRLFTNDGVQSTARSIGAVLPVATIAGSGQTVLVAGVPTSGKLQYQLFDHLLASSGPTLTGAAAQPGSPALAYLSDGRVVVVYLNGATIYGQFLAIG